MPPAKIAEPQPAGNAAVASEAARANEAASPASGGEVAVSAARTVQEQVAAATALAECATTASAAPVPQQEANNVETSGRAEAAQPSDTEQTASAPTSNTNNADNLVAVLMARPEITSISDLTGKDVAIAEPQSASGATIRTAIAAAGAAEVRLNEGHAKAIDRLIAGEVPAAILTLASPEAAEWFPDIAGYRIFRIPLSPRSVKARP